MKKRPEVLKGKTYKFKTPNASSSYYITINDIREDDKLRPYELFINTKDLTHYSWLVGLSRLASALLRTEEDPSLIVEELKTIFDPNGGWFESGSYVPSLTSKVGRVLEEHIKSYNPPIQE